MTRENEVENRCREYFRQLLEGNEMSKIGEGDGTGEERTPYVEE